MAIKIWRLEGGLLPLPDRMTQMLASGEHGLSVQLEDCKVSQCGCEDGRMGEWPDA